MAQKYTEAKKEGNRRWDAANLDRMSIAFPKGTKAEIQAATAITGESMNAFICRLVKEEISRLQGLG